MRNEKCSDGKQNGDETDVDCGGDTCAGCADGLACLSHADCADGYCSDGLCGLPVTALGTGDTLRLIERFTRIDEHTLLYEFTVDDPQTFTRPFTASVPMKRNAEPMFEYACHEGNYGMFNMLTAGRAEDDAQPGAK